METALKDDRSIAVVAAAALALAVAGALAIVGSSVIGFATPDTESVFLLLVVVGWVLLVWSALLGVSAAVAILRVRGRHRSVRAATALLLATGVVVALTVAGQPLVGMGAGVG